MAKKKNGNTALVIAQPQTLQAVKDALAENLAGENISEFDLMRVRVPGGGSTTWELPDDVASKEISGVIIHKRLGNVYWQQGHDEGGGNQPPDCSSNDAITGLGEPGGDCATCPLNQFGSAEDGKGKLCKNYAVAYLVPPKELLPVAVIFPPTSLRNLRQHMLRLASQGKRYWEYIHSLTLEKAQSTNGQPYAKICIGTKEPLGKDTLKGIGEYAQLFKSSFGESELTISQGEVQ